MRLLICTQIVDKNDSILGFFHAWIVEFSKNFDSVIVICLKEGEHKLPSNVRVLTLGKEKGFSRIKYIFRFYSYIWSQRNHHDCVFVHMNPEYVLLGGIFWRLMRKRIGLWYVHKSVTMTLRIAIYFVHHVFTTSPESFRIETDKRLEIGHGIDTELFAPSVHSKSETLRVITIGRISATKHIAEMIDAVSILSSQNEIVSLSIVGEPITILDHKYDQELRENIERKGLSEKIIFKGVIQHHLISKELRQADVFLNLSETGSMDKAVLEALASGIPVVTSNEAFRSLLEPLGLFVSLSNTEDTALVLKKAKNVNTEDLVKYVQNYHSLPRLINRISNELYS
jgi:glycosyltransferase involved in cell wall biosynthesis